MRVLVKLFVFLVAFSSLSIASAASLDKTTWTTIDDKTGKPRAEVVFEEDNGVLSARIVNVNHFPGDTGICSKCPGKFKDKPTKGLVFVWGVKSLGDDEFGNGEILDPKTGKIYRVKMTLKGDKLYVRGYIGISLLGRTQVWQKK